MSLRRWIDCEPVAVTAVVASLLALVPGVAPASTDSIYQVPPQVLVDIVDAPPTPEVSLAPQGDWLLILERPSHPAIAELAEPELRLAGVRIRPHTNGPSRTRPYSSLRLLRIADGEERGVTGLPKEARIDHVTWSPDGSRVAFTYTHEKGIELWVLEVATGNARRLAAGLNLALDRSPRWLPDGRALLATLVLPHRGPEPDPPAVPPGPVIQETAGRKAPARTYQDLLENRHDEALFDHYFTAQLVRIGLDGTVTHLGEPGIFRDFDPSPDGRYIWVEVIHRPYSYLVPFWRFPYRAEIWDRDGRLVRRIADLPLQEEVPITFGSVPTGPRNFQWRADAPATLAWVEALDGGDAGAEAEWRDRVFLLAAPFQGEPVPLVTLALRYAGMEWGTDDLALVYESWWKTRKQRTWIVRPGSPGAAPELLFDRSWEDRYGDPGLPVTRWNQMGRKVLRTTAGGKALFLMGEGASPEGNRPFLDSLDLATRATRRLFRSEAPDYERPVDLLDEAGVFLLTRRESVEEPPNYYLRDLAGGAVRQLTAFPHPAPQLVGIQKELIRYFRQDGVQLTGTLYLPPGWTKEQGPLPVLMWAYPIEFKSADYAGQVTDSPYRFVRPSWTSPVLWLLLGYAVLDDPAMPIVGEGDEEPNDTYVEQLVLSAQAAVDEVVRRGIGERGRMAIGGHSYGAFMTANLLAHSDLFAAGIARSGAYNRTLTPFGFQAEERTLWEAPEIYFAMSPFMHAHRVNEPILLIHGEADNNSGTYPMQSERFYNALKGLGKTARLVMLPHESHGYRARESVLHVLWETHRWLEMYVKGGKAEEVPRVEPVGGGGGPR